MTTDASVLQSLLTLHPIQHNPHRQENYLQYFGQDRLNDIEYPVNPVDIPQIEERLNLSINLYSYFDDVNKAHHPMYISRHNSLIQIDLHTSTDTTRGSKTSVGYSTT